MSHKALDTWSMLDAVGLDAVGHDATLDESGQESEAAPNRLPPASASRSVS